MGNTESNFEPPAGAVYPPPPQTQYDVVITDDRPIPLQTIKEPDAIKGAADKEQEVSVFSSPNTSNTTTNKPPYKNAFQAAAAAATAATGPAGIDESEAFNPNDKFGPRALKHGISDLPDSCRAATNNAKSRFEEEEQFVRNQAKHSIAWLTVVNGWSAIMVFVVHLISAESVLSVILSVGFTIFTYFSTKDKPDFDGASLDWVLLSFAVITPLSASIGMAFSRREKALQHITVIRATMINIYSAHACWDWCKAGKEDSTGRSSSTTMRSWLDHADATLIEILGVCHSLSRFLTLPNATRARHRITKQGRREAHQTLILASKLYGCMGIRLGRLTDLCEVLKAEGLPPNEATRIRQWERMVLENADGLRMLKVYRTPQALRSFARLFTVLLPPLYAPFYSDVARSVGSLGVGVTFSVLTSLALTALFETISQMEDPFLSYASLDGVDVDCELSSSFVVQCLTMRSHFFRDAKPFDERDVATSTCERLPVQQFALISQRRG